jgi:hypothetical protein
MRKYRTTYDAIGEAKAVFGVIEVSEQVAAAMGLGEPIDEPPPVKTADEQQAEAIALFLSQKAEDVIAKVTTAPADKAEQLRATREVEAKGKNRTTVLAAIDAQLKSFDPKE